MVEILGYTSMVIVLISMLMENIRTLRIINSIACSMFVVYGLLLSAYPIVIMNVCVIIINLYQIKKGK